MTLVRADERGRVNLGRGILYKYGKKFNVVPTPREILLIPVPKDAVKDLRELARETGMSKLSPNELKEEARNLAEKLATASWRKIQKAKRRR
jgi:hypothetical protein